MNNIQVSFEALKRGKQWYEGAIEAFKHKRWNDVVYMYQMAIEQAMKSILILYGIEYPRRHDISTTYRILKQQEIPKWFTDKIDNQADLLKNLVKLRGLAAYGYVNGYGKDDFKEDAFFYKEQINQIIQDCTRLLNDFLKNHEQNINPEKN
ncbi:MAG: HEPN domain-containing protein [Promethearchaeota archaeon]